ncbi:unnamed protein product, partial [Prorocentrum cordatum]
PATLAAGPADQCLRPGRPAALAAGPAAHGDGVRAIGLPGLQGGPPPRARSCGAGGPAAADAAVRGGSGGAAAASRRQQGAADPGHAVERHGPPVRRGAGAGLWAAARRGV